MNRQAVTLNDLQDPYLYKDALDKWIKDYNMYLPYSTLEWKTTYDFEKYYMQPLTKFPFD
ncbi:MAG: hypothetical protein JXA99_17110 [Candidatus Lokiarchaeota archaeon]|nr:hypothetical protein [Candidatus Lokiarchaeota archaeon]